MDSAALFIVCLAAEDIHIGQLQRGFLVLHIDTAAHLVGQAGADRAVLQTDRSLVHDRDGAAVIVDDLRLIGPAVRDQRVPERDCAAHDADRSAVLGRTAIIERASRHAERTVNIDQAACVGGASSLDAAAVEGRAGP